ncbi:MAG TPA: N-acetylmuramic acid 6-phosphate etherase [Tepidisphaeraceae bacterium]|nr:N-acetylmuramic acid 6-phosphate etherase [Tepidisphaeraceae bacterium]
MDDRSHILTEHRLTESMGLDELSTDAALELMNAQDAQAVAAVAAVRKEVAQAIDMVAAALASGGRLIYFGAGTSGRLGVLDAAECPPTFRTDPAMIQGVIAGGDSAMFHAVEGAEDSPQAGRAAVDEKNLGPRDIAIGIAAGGTTPFVRGVLERARQRHARTIFLCCVLPTPAEPPADLVIRPLTGPEVLTGSTRLKAGTATKLILNQITTLSMVRLGKVYENLMVDLKATNDKLRDRAIRIVSALTRLDRQRSHALLDSAAGNVKIALVMHFRGVQSQEAQRLLDSTAGNLGPLIKKLI